MRASTIGRTLFAALAVLTITTGVMVEQMTKPDEAKACPLCAAIAGVGAYELITTGIVAGAAVGIGTQLGRIGHNAEDRAKAIHRPGGASWERFMKKVRHRRALGAHVWRGSLSKMANWFKNHVGTIRIKRHWPTGAWYCLISATGSYMANGDLRDAALACIGGFLAGVTTPPRGKYAPMEPVSAPSWYDSAMRAEIGPWSALVPDDSAEYVPSWVTASESQ